MTRIGITGHQGLPAEAVPYVTQRVRGILTKTAPPLIGYGCLAEGADQLFAHELLDAGGELHVVIPAEGYDGTFSDTDKGTYFALLYKATSVTRLPFEAPSEKAYDAAGQWVTKHCETLIAVWDGQPARGLGGTADAVAHARKLGRTVQVVWPDGVHRA
ncbi:hypothetical protein TK78_05990 [Streptomyces sp. Tue 6075]|uniref:hypothetical protein n=1 Tax=Streptomyces sp. Tue 6075 TaxID=1661694 RepID=UPI00094A4917|nr:hypothetical protein [Streptomyces sp. Tue 6075]APS18551.1 hypothetical protein TK78_05990 [Streptomyces sp. Tue 6075]